MGQRCSFAGSQNEQGELKSRAKVRDKYFIYHYLKGAPLNPNESFIKKGDRGATPDNVKKSDAGIEIAAIDSPNKKSSEEIKEEKPVESKDGPVEHQQNHHHEAKVDDDHKEQAPQQQP